MTQEANPGLVFLEKVRLSFPHLAAPQASDEGGEPKFNADFIMEPNHPGYAAFHAQVQVLATEKWREQAGPIIQWINTDRKLRAYGAGEESIDKKTMQPYAGYPGMVHISANNAVQPILFDANGTRLMDARKFYGGCYVNVQVKPWLQDNKHGRGVRCELVGVQFHSDGEAFGVAPADPNSLFGAIPGAPAAIAPQAPAPGGYQPPPLGVPGQPAPGGYAPPPVQQPPVQQPPVQPPAYQPPVQQPGGYTPPPAAQTSVPAAPYQDPTTGQWVFPQ